MKVKIMTVLAASLFIAGAIFNAYVGRNNSTNALGLDALSSMREASAECPGYREAYDGYDYYMLMCNCQYVHGNGIGTKC